MKMKGSTILITGGGSGIGLGLAKEFQNLGNQIIIAGRGNRSLDEAVKANSGFHGLKVDMADLASIQSFASKLTAEFPALNAVIHCAGVMMQEDLLNGSNFETEDKTVQTNLLGPMRLTELLLPTLRKQPEAAIMTVTSGLAFVPMAISPTYCATKAGIHSYTQSLRFQLRGTKIQVIELAPPYVATELTGERQAKDPNAMPLDEFIRETMQILTDQPQAEEILVKRVLPLRFSAENGQEKYNQFFQQFNQQAEASRKTQ